MRKTLLSCVVASAMALACTATSFAAVSYGENNQLAVKYTADGNKLAVESGWNTGDAQVTLLVVKGNNPSSINDSDILYIDQQAQADAAKAFATVGLLGEDALAEGTYTVKAGGSAGNVYVSTFTVEKDAPTIPDVKFKWGDVNASGAVDSDDAIDILVYGAGGAAKVGSAVYSMGEEVSANVKYGDVNASGAVDSDDAIDILVYGAGGAAKVGSAAYSMGEDVTLPGLAK